MSHPEKLSLKNFWDTLEGNLDVCSAEELRAILRAMAQRIPPGERRNFLEQLTPPKEITTPSEDALQREDLLNDIDDLHREIKAAMGAADEPWDNDYGWGEYDDEDSLGPYEEFVEPIAALFDKVEAAFDYGNRPLTREGIDKLSNLLMLEDDYGRGIRFEDLSGVDKGEIRARYLRAVYDMEPLEQRPAVIFERMFDTLTWNGAPRPMLDDLIQISVESLPDREQFLESWIAFLQSQTGEHPDAWLREAVYLLHGIPGLAELARTEGVQRPRAYLDWLAALEGEGRHIETLEIAQEALQTLPPKLPIRAAIADHLCNAAAQVGDENSLCRGRWEAFTAKPTLLRLLDWWDANPEEERSQRMLQAAHYIHAYLTDFPQRRVDSWISKEDNLEAPALIDHSVLAHAFLLAGDWRAAYQLGGKHKALGWSVSSNPQGLVLAYFLAALSGRAFDSLTYILAQLWEDRLQASLGFGYWSISLNPRDELSNRLNRIYATKFPSFILNETEQGKILSWCLKVANQRVDGIVGNQRRKSYWKAALVIAACAETIHLRGDAEEARRVLDEASARYPRHRAFQAELRAAIQKMQQ